MRLNEIIERFRLISGFDRKTVTRWLPLIADCKMLFESWSGEADDAALHRLEHACAVYCYYRLSLIAQMSDLESFKVGDVQMNIRINAAEAEKMWEIERMAVTDIADFDDGFSFRSVRV